MSHDLESFSDQEESTRIVEGGDSCVSREVILAIEIPQYYRGSEGFHKNMYMYIIILSKKGSKTVAYTCSSA